MTHLRLLLILTLLATIGHSAEAAMPLPPPQSGIQGVLRDASGNPLQGTFNVTFKLFDAEVGGNEILVDTHGGIDAIEITGGLLRSTIGGGVVSDGSGPGTFATLPDAYREHGQMFLEIEIEGETLSPRVPLTSAPYAQLSGKANYVEVDDSLELNRESTEQIRIKPGNLAFPDGRTRGIDSDLLWDFANGIGPLGLDEGTEQADTWYYLYAIPDAIDETAYTVIASDNAPPKVGGTGPTGFANARFIGSFFNDAASDVASFFRIGNRVWAVTPVLVNNCSGPQPVVNTWVEFDLSGKVPETAEAIMLNGYYDSFGSAAISFLLRPKLDAGPNIGFCPQNTSSNANRCDTTVPIPDGSFFYRADLFAGSNDANQCTIWDIYGYLENVSRY